MGEAMRVVIPAIAARDVLERRMRAVFGDAFAGICPEAKQPKVYLGYPTDEPPFYVAVDEVVDTAFTSGSASMGHARVDFALRLWLFAKHRALQIAADTLLSYIDVAFAAVLADQRLDFTVDNAFPSIETAATAATSDKRYMAAASVAISCQVGSACPAEIMEVVRASNRNG